MAERDSGIQVTGLGTASAVPDLMVLDAGVEAVAASAGEAFSSARVGLEALRRAVAAAGIDESDLQTSTVSLHPSYDRDGGRAGHVSEIGVLIKVRDISRSGVVIDAVTAAADQIARVNGIRLEHSDPRALRQQARADAFRDARSKAEEYARLSGRRLGTCSWIAEGAASSPRPMQAMRSESAMADVAMAVDPGQVEVTQSVTAMWSFAD